MKKARGGPYGRILEKTGAKGGGIDTGQERERRATGGTWEKARGAADAGELNKGRKGKRHLAEPLTRFFSNGACGPWEGFKSYPLRSQRKGPMPERTRFARPLAQPAPGA